MNRELYKRAIETFGVEAQVWMAIEEMSELIQAICKKRRGKVHNIEEEIVDCLIVLGQINIKFHIKGVQELDEKITDTGLIYSLNDLSNYLLLYLTEYGQYGINRKCLNAVSNKIIKYSEQFDQELINKWMQIKENRLGNLIEYNLKSDIE